MCIPLPSTGGRVCYLTPPPLERSVWSRARYGHFPRPAKGFVPTGRMGMTQPVAPIRCEAAEGVDLNFGGGIQRSREFSISRVTSPIGAMPLRLLSLPWAR